jgi:hypothetical protein
MTFGDTAVTIRAMLRLASLTVTIATLALGGGVAWGQSDPPSGPAIPGPIDWLYPSQPQPGEQYTVIDWVRCPGVPDPVNCTHGPDPLCAFDGTSCDPARMAAVERVRAACASSRRFGGIVFQGPRTVVAPLLRVGPRVGSVLIVRQCQPKWLGNDPPRALGRTHRLYRLFGLSPRVALSLDGSPRRILIANKACAATRTDAALIRCLKRS